MEGDSPIVVLDACVVINLVATEHPLLEFSPSGKPFLLGERAAAEAMYLAPTGDETEPQRIDMTAQPTRDGVEIVRLRGTETSLFVALAQMLDDGEAEAMTIAVNRGMALATDDRKARRVATELQPGVRLVSTSDLIRVWVSKNEIADVAASSALGAIERRACFVPPRSDPNREWWAATASDD